MRILELHTDSDPVSLGDARRRVREAMTRAGLAHEAVWDMEVAVGEALSNVYRHAYSTGVGPVSVEVLTTGAALTVLVHDEGVATAPPVIPRTLPRRSNPGGRGLYMAGRLADDVEICVNPAGHGVTVRMTARLQRPLV